MSLVSSSSNSKPIKIKTKNNNDSSSSSGSGEGKEKEKGGILLKKIRAETKKDGKKIITVRQISRPSSSSFVDGNLNNQTLGVVGAKKKKGRKRSVSSIDEIPITVDPNEIAADFDGNIDLLRTRCQEISDTCQDAKQKCIRNLQILADNPSLSEEQILSSSSSITLIGGEEKLLAVTEKLDPNTLRKTFTETQQLCKLYQDLQKTVDDLKELRNNLTRAAQLFTTSHYAYCLNSIKSDVCIQSLVNQTDNLHDLNTLPTDLLLIPPEVIR